MVLNRIWRRIVRACSLRDLPPGPPSRWPFSRPPHKMNRLWALALILLALIVPAEAQEFPEPTLYELVPADGSYPIARVCYTQEGICALPLYIPPGRPCECRRPDGTWVSGVCTH